MKWDDHFLSLSRSSDSKLTLLVLLILSRVLRWRRVQSRTLTPLLPALPVLPERCTKDSTSLGGSVCTTNLMSGKSRPLAATLVAITVVICPDLKLRQMRSRSACFTSPWRAAQPLPNSEQRLLTCRLVSQKTMVLPSLLEKWSISRPTASTSSLSSISTRQCLMVLGISAALETRSTTSQSFSWYLAEIESTQGGKVAEKSRFWILRSSLEQISAKIFSMSSSKLCRSISSASSRQVTRISLRSTTPLPMRSISLPGVATTMSAPRSSRAIWFLIGSPPQTPSTLNSPSLSMSISILPTT